jgi:hypothetical protein
MRSRPRRIRIPCIDFVQRNEANNSEADGQARKADGEAMSIKVIFACHQCGSAFEALQEHTDGQGEFACTDCGLTVHDWHGQYDYTRWAAFTPALLVRTKCQLDWHEWLLPRLRCGTAPPGIGNFPSVSGRW